MFRVEETNVIIKIKHPPGSGTESKKNILNLGHHLDQGRNF